MAAAVPLPPKEQRRAFLKYTLVLPRTSLRGYGEAPLSPSPHIGGGSEEVMKGLFVSPLCSFLSFLFWDARGRLPNDR